MRLLKWQMIISISLITFIIGCLLTYVIFIKNAVFLSRISIVTAIITGIGSALGGLIGGIIAFGIARSQFMEDNLRDKKSKNQIYLNLMKALKTELEHNKRILRIISNDISEKDVYVKLLDSDAWDNIKYNNNNFLPTTIYSVLDEQSREFKDIQMRIIPDYDKFDENDFKLRLDTTNKIIEEITKEESKIINKPNSKI